MIENLSVDSMKYGTTTSLKLYAEHSTVTFTVKLLINSRSQIDAGGSDICVIINAESGINAGLPTNAGSLIDSQTEHI